MKDIKLTVDTTDLYEFINEIKSGAINVEDFKQGKLKIDFTVLEKCDELVYKFFIA